MSTKNNKSLSSSEEDSPPGLKYSLCLQSVFIADKKIKASITSRVEHTRDWIRDVVLNNRTKPLRLIVGLDIKLENPQPPVIATFYPTYRRIAALLLYVYRSCLIFEVLVANKIPKSLSRFLSDQGNNTFVGIGIESKLEQLQQECGLGGSAHWVDLGGITAERYNRPELSDAGVSQLRMFLHGADVERPSPAVVDDWDDELTDEHVSQACADAYTCYELGSFLVFPSRRRRAPEDK